jgi:hypothetical protein
MQGSRDLMKRMQQSRDCSGEGLEKQQVLDHLTICGRIFPSPESEPSRVSVSVSHLPYSSLHFASLHTAGLSGVYIGSKFTTVEYFPRPLILWSRNKASCHPGIRWQWSLFLFGLFLSQASILKLQDRWWCMRCIGALNSCCMYILLYSFCVLTDMLLGGMGTDYEFYWKSSHEHLASQWLLFRVDMGTENQSLPQISWTSLFL